MIFLSIKTQGVPVANSTFSSLFVYETATSRQNDREYIRIYLTF